jgi:chromosome segregation ATPase
MRFATSILVVFALGGSLIVGDDRKDDSQVKQPEIARLQAELAQAQAAEALAKEKVLAIQTVMKGFPQGLSHDATRNAKDLEVVEKEWREAAREAGSTSVEMKVARALLDMAERRLKTLNDDATASNEARREAKTKLSNARESLKKAEEAVKTADEKFTEVTLKLLDLELSGRFLQADMLEGESMAGTATVGEWDAEEATENRVKAERRLQEALHPVERLCE